MKSGYKTETDNCSQRGTGNAEILERDATFMSGQGIGEKKGGVKDSFVQEAWS